MDSNPSSLKSVKELIEPLSLELDFDLSVGFDGHSCDPTGLITCCSGKV